MRNPIHPLWGLLEIAGITLSFFIGLWVLGPGIAVGKVPPVAFWLLIAAFAVYVLWFSPAVLHQDSLEDRGWADFVSDQEAGAFGNAWRVYAAFTAFGALVMVILAAWRDPANLTGLNWTALGIKLAGYVMLGLSQAIFFFGFVHCRFKAMIPVPSGPRAVFHHRVFVALALSIVFSFYHLPNYLLMLFAFLAGFSWSLIFYNRPNVLLLGISHALLGTLLHRVVQLYMRTGPFYDNPDLFILRTVFPGLRAIIGSYF